MAPLPTKIIGVLLPAIREAAALTRSGSGSGAGKGSNGFAGPTSVRWVKTSQGISSATGPRRPDSISWNARETSAGARFDPPRYLKPGDVVEVEAENIGVLRNGVIDEAP